MTEKVKNKTTDFYCNFCDYKCSRKYLYDKHLSTQKHRKMVNGDIKGDNAFQCECGKSFKFRQGLHRHKKDCSIIDNNLEVGATLPSIIELIKQNSEFKELILEQNKALQEQNKSLFELASKRTTVNNNFTTNNQKFNLNFFLNTTCKDAINLSEFIENINIEFEDIENIGRNGYVSGMTNMILSRIKDMDVTKRPVHCTDVKREVMYIKENDTWNKDTPGNNKLRRMINIVASQNYGTINLWREKYPESRNLDNPKYDFSINMMRNILGDVGEEQIKLDNKVIKNIAKQLLIQK
tara:strand:- start:4550 stop:5434 length:885 start_codon:yes stop_codon:yes gene_type:complete